jgi:hypothetical protein
MNPQPANQPSQTPNQLPNQSTRLMVVSSFARSSLQDNQLTLNKEEDLNETTNDLNILIRR